MMRWLLCAVLAVALCAVTVLAKEYEGNITKIDPDKHTLTVRVNGEEKTFAYTDATEFTNPKGKVLAQEKLANFKTGKKGRPAKIETEEKGGKEVKKNGNPVAAKVTLKAGKKKKKQ